MIEETSAGIVLFRKEGSKKLFLLLHCMHFQQKI